MTLFVMEGVSKRFGGVRALSDNFFVGNSFPTCGINFTAQEIMGQTEANK